MWAYKKSRLEREDYFLIVREREVNKNIKLLFVIVNE